MRPQTLNKSFPGTTWVTLFILAHFLGWTLVPLLTRYNLPLDAIEGTLWGHQLEWGYDKNPYLNGWLTGFAGSIGGQSGWLIYAFSQLSVVACFIAVYKLGVRILQPAYALIAVLLLEAIQYYNFHAIDFNDNTLELGCWGLTSYFFYMALRSRQPLWYWGLTGLFAGFGMMAKYYTAALLAAMFCLMVFNKDARKHFFSFGFCFGIFTFALVTLPHFMWLFGHDFITVKYVFARGSSVPHWSNHFFFPALFAWQQFEAFLPALLIACGFFLRRKQYASLPSVSHFDEVYLWWIGFGPFFLTLLLSLILGTNLRAGWGMPLLSLWGISLIAMLQPELTVKKMYVFIGTMFLLLCVLLTGYRLSLTHSNTESSANFPGREIAATITQLWQSKYHTKLTYVAGSRWVGGNIEFYSPDHPAVFVEWRHERADWIDEAALREKGAVFVWDINGHETLPEEVRKEYPTLAGEKVLLFKWWRDDGKLEPIRIGVVILPPRKAFP